MTDLEGHGGDLALAALRARGVTELFTLSGGHVFPLYDAAIRGDVRIVDVRHEQTAVFAAEATARLTRRPGLAVLTAGPGVTNGVSAVTTAYFNGAPVVVLAGRAALSRWGSGSLQEIDHVPLLAPVTKHAATVADTAAVAPEVAAAADLALGPHRGPVFLDLPLEVAYSRATVPALPEPAPPSAVEPDPDEVARALALLAGAERPVLVAGSDVYAGAAEDALVAAAEVLRLPVILNGMGRGCLPADHPLAFSRARSTAFAEADVVAVVGTPLDFRLGFGAFGDARVVHVVDAPSQRATHVAPAAAPAGDLRNILTVFAAGAPATDHDTWIARLRDAERAAREADMALLEADTDPIAPARVYGELRRVLDRDAVVIGDGGDFVSYAGRLLDMHLPGRWLDPGPFGCLGTGPGYAMAARLAHPSAQVCLLLGDGAAGFSLGDLESLARHRLPVAIVLGNNGAWGLEKHPMRQLFGYDVAADLQPGLRYDEVAAALGGAGEVVERADQIGPALRRAFDAGVPYLVNVLTDPTDAYPRSATLA